MKKSLLTLLLLPLPLYCQQAQEEQKQEGPELKKLIVAAWKISSRISPDPQKLNYVFDKSFFNYVSRDKMTEIFKQLHAENGSVVNVSTVSYKGGLTADFFFYTDKDFIIPATVTVENSKWKVTGLFFRPAFKNAPSLAESSSPFEKLPYQNNAILIKRLSGLEDNIYAKNEAKPMPIGSAFKLYVLAWLAENDAPWDKIIKIRERDKSLPTGRLQNFPEGSPFTVFSLAQAMISESDNTAADMLIDFIGREKIENSLSLFHNSFVDLNRPFLKTSEMFKLKSDPQLAARYALADLKSRRKILKELEKKPLPDIKSVYPGNKASYINAIEWFASPEDICRLMDYFRKKNNAKVNAVLSLNPGLDIKTGGFKYAGYKGGGEPGVISMNWLLETKSSTWYCVSSGSSDESRPIDNNSYFQTMQSVINQVGMETF